MNETAYLCSGCANKLKVIEVLFSGIPPGTMCGRCGINWASGKYRSSLPPVEPAPAPEPKTKISDLIVELVHMMRQHGDLEVAVIVDDNIKSEETQIDDVSTSIFQVQVVVDNTVKDHRFLGIVGTIREEWEKNVPVQPLVQRGPRPDRPQHEPAHLPPL